MNFECWTPKIKIQYKISLRKCTRVTLYIVFLSWQTLPFCLLFIDCRITGIVYIPIRYLIIIVHLVRCVKLYLIKVFLLKLTFFVYLYMVYGSKFTLKFPTFCYDKINKFLFIPFTFWYGSLFSLILIPPQVSLKVNSDITPFYVVNTLWLSVGSKTVFFLCVYVFSYVCYCSSKLFLPSFMRVGDQRFHIWPCWYNFRQTVTNNVQY